ncbi:hypothetical protein TNCV_1016371 [Trichonephila clavipes]|uniref:Uncharacterized protein n=1 Tax=Trichonephila clavipes TaxID=2585209 RepID=A0A8X6VY95_TRICX|nr:hypothetical protein TNCV_1016371 [Trichonephila clavipes]
MFDELKRNILRAISNINSHALHKVSINLICDENRLDIGERKGVAASKPFSESAHICYPLGMRKEWPVFFGRYNVHMDILITPYVNLDKYWW